MVNLGESLNQLSLLISPPLKATAAGPATPSYTYEEEIIYVGN